MKIKVQRTVTLKDGLTLQLNESGRIRNSADTLTGFARTYDPDALSMSFGSWWYGTSSDALGLLPVFNTGKKDRRTHPAPVVATAERARLAAAEPAPAAPEPPSPRRRRRAAEPAPERAETLDDLL